MRRLGWLLLAGASGCVLQTETVSGPQGDAGPDGAAIADLKLQIDMLKQEVETLKTQNWNLDPNGHLLATNSGNVGIGVTAPETKLEVAGAVRCAGDILPYGYTQTETINVRGFYRKSDANAACPNGSKASYVPWSWRGRTGNEICAGDQHPDAVTTCVAVKYVYITSDNVSGSNPALDLPCGDQVHYPWPWGHDYSDPDTFDGEYLHGDVHVVCCK